MTFTLFKHGKVKDFYVDPDNMPTDREFGIGFQTWPDDRFSLFDYGTFPDMIEGKADAMYRETINFFRIMGEEGIPSHYMHDMGNRKMAVRVARIPPDYEWIEPGETSIYLIPIEVVFSQYITPVSSLHKRLRSGKEKPEDFGLEKAPERGETVVLKEPRITFSTKIEAVDRYETETGQDLAELAGLVGNEKERLTDLALTVYGVIQKDAERAGLIVADGKIECVMGPGRNIYVADSCWTWDENRILAEGPRGRLVDLSKQFPRNIYTINGYKSKLKGAQDADIPKEDWPEPPSLHREQLRAVEMANSAVRKAILGERDGPSLNGAARRAATMLDRMKSYYKRDETGAEI